MKILLAFILSLFSLTAFADEISMGYGKMNDITSATISFTWAPFLFPLKDVDVVPEVGVSRFRKFGDTLDQIYYSPNLRYHVTKNLILDGGIGVSLINKDTFGTKAFGTRFQFVDHIGFSYSFGSVIVGYRIQHISNASIKKPNPGINSQFIMLSIPIDP